MKKQKIKTRVLSGFVELLPKEQIAFDKIKDTIKTVYAEFGFLPIDTPVIERSEVLLAKAGGETEKQIYQFKKGNEDVALRFDLTIPLARYVAEHFPQLSFPFRRSQIAKVYRGERPQKGRYREFYQCDIDIIGDGNLSLMNDAEMPNVIYTIFKRLNVGPFIICLNNRKLINGLMLEIGINNLSVEVMRIIDKIEKIGEESTKEMLKEIGVSNENISSIFGFLSIKGTNTEIISKLRELSFKDKTFQTGVDELEEVISNIKLFGVPEDYFTIDLAVMRGHDYYTGTVYETNLVDYPEIGSVCGGGRFDNLAEKYTNKKLPGVGISIGLTRLFAQLRDVDLIKIDSLALAKVLIVPLSKDHALSLRVASDLRKEGVSTSVYYEDVKIKKKMKYADNLGIPFVILIGEDEINSNILTVKNMESSKQTKVPVGEIVKYFKNC